ncbi:MAG TPA: glycosyltransferase [Jiangellaceae bacterium]|nr:glycosyltransferase [Jiangellaceae bacterium]
MDIRSDNPVGRVPDTRMTKRHVLRLGAQGWKLGRHQGPWTSAALDRILTALDTAHAMHWTGSIPPGQAPLFAELVHRSVARGTFVSGEVDERTATHLPDGLASTIQQTPHPGEVGDLDWDVHAVVQRRAALTPILGSLPPLSVVLVSRRPELIVPMVRRLATQRYHDLEIVVATHGVPLPAGIDQAAGDRHLVMRELDGALLFGEALNEAFALASGTLVSKMDDDDHIGPDHLWDLAAAHTYSRATLVGKTTTVVHLEALDATVRRVYGARETFTHRVAGSTMTLSAADLRSVGGWPPVRRGVDTALLASLGNHDGTVYQPHDIGYLYVRGHDPQQHTWTADAGHFLRNVREQWIGLLHHPAFGTEEGIVSG